jgi:hypothetical protein
LQIGRTNYDEKESKYQKYIYYASNGYQYYGESGQDYFEKALYENLTFEIPPLWFLPASPKAEAGLGIALFVRPSKAVLT